MRSRAHIHEKVLLAGLLVSVGALPFSIIVCHAGLILIIVNWAIQGQWREKLALLRQNPIALAFIAFFCWHLAGLFYTEDTANGWFNIEKKFSFAIIPVVIATSVISGNSKILVLKAFVLCCFVGSLYCLGNSFYRMVFPVGPDHVNFGAMQPGLLLANPLFNDHWQQLSYIALASAIQIHPAYFSVYIIFCISILIAGHQNNFFNKKLRAGLTVYFTGFLALLSARITLAVLLIVSLFGVAYFLAKISTRNLKKLALGATMAGLFLFLSALNPISLYRDFQEIRHSTYDIGPNSLFTNSTTVRLSLWWTGFMTASEVNSTVGTGTGDVHHEMRKTAKHYKVANILNSTDPHNQYLYTYISLGLLGTVLLLGCYVLPMKRAIHCGDMLHLSFIGLVLIVSFTESFLESQKGIVFFVLFQSLLTFSKPDGTASSKWARA